MAAEDSRSVVVYYLTIVEEVGAPYVTDEA